MYVEELEAIKKALALWNEGEEFAEAVANYIYSLRDEDYTFLELEYFVKKNNTDISKND